MNIAATVKSLGFEPTIPLPETLSPAAWGQSGHSWLFVFEQASAEALARNLDEIRAVVNAQYWLPRPMRFRAPYMAVIGIVDAPDPALDAAVRASEFTTWMGGESFHLVSATRSTSAVVLPEPKGHRNQRVVWQMGLKMRRPDRYAEALLKA